MCGAHRRKPPSEDNDEEQTASGDGSEQNYQLSALKPATEKFVLGPAIIQPEPIVVFTGPPGNPDQVEQTPTPTKKPKTQAVAKKDDAAPAENKNVKPKTAAKKEGAAPAENKDAKPKTAAKKDAAAPKEAKKDGEVAAKPAAKKPSPKKDKAAAAAPAQ
jgi:hypothetical protein